MPQKGKRCCAWCEKIIATTSTAKNVYCSRGCRDANILFYHYESDENINRRKHYKELCKGEGDGQ